MSENWFYSHAGRVHGPLSAEQLLGLAGTGALNPDDLIWPQSIDPVAAIPAASALAFPDAPPVPPTSRPPSPLPEWVRALTEAGLDARALEGMRPAPPQQWLDDVRLDADSPRPAADPPPARDVG